LTHKVTFFAQNLDTTILMDEHIEASHPVIKRMLTITTVETWVITLCWWDSQSPAGDAMEKPEPVDKAWLEEDEIEVEK
jgi:hypothetical protein